MSRYLASCCEKTKVLGERCRTLMRSVPAHQDRENRAATAGWWAVATGLVWVLFLGVGSQRGRSWGRRSQTCPSTSDLGFETRGRNWIAPQHERRHGKPAVEQQRAEFDVCHTPYQTRPGGHGHARQRIRSEPPMADRSCDAPIRDGDERDRRHRLDPRHGAQQPRQIRASLHNCLRRRPRAGRERAGHGCDGDKHQQQSAPRCSARNPLHGRRDRADAVLADWPGVAGAASAHTRAGQVVRELVRSFFQAPEAVISLIAEW